MNRDLIIAIASLLIGFFLTKLAFYIWPIEKSKPIERSPTIIETRIKIAIVDTGIIFNEETERYVCKTGNEDFTGLGLIDTHGHGTNVAGLISKDLNYEDYCLLILKYWRPDFIGNSLERELAAINKAIKEQASYINLSLGGTDFSNREETLINKALSKNIKVVVSAGNNSTDLSKTCNYWPACIKANSNNFYVVGSCSNNKYHYFSNYNGPVKQCEDGLKRTGFGIKMGGTSQAAAIFTNKLIKYDQNR